MTASTCDWCQGPMPSELVDLFPGSGGVARAWTYASGAARHDDRQLRLIPTS